MKWTCARAAAALWRFPHRAELFVPALLRALSDPEAEVRASAAGSLAESGGEPDIVIPALIGRVRDRGLHWVSLSACMHSQEPVGHTVAAALGRYLKSRMLPVPLEELGELDVESLVLLLQELDREFLPAAVAPRLLELIEDGDVSGSVLLARIGSVDDGTLTRLQLLLDHDEEDVRCIAAAALIGVDFGRQPRAREIARELLTPNARTGERHEGDAFILKVLGELGPPAAHFLPELLNALNSDQVSQSDIVETLARIGPAAASAGPVLLRNLMGDRVLDFEESAYFDALAAMGESQVPEILDAAFAPATPDERRPRLLRAIARFGPDAESAVPRLVALVVVPDFELRTAAIETLGRVRSRPEIAVPALQQALHDSRPELRIAAIRSLAAFGEAALPATRELAVTLSDDYVDVRVAAAETLCALPNFPPSVREALHGAAEDSNPYVRRLARKALAGVSE